MFWNFWGKAWIPKFAMAECLPNVFRSNRSVDVTYRNYTLVEATMVCLQDLSEKPYKYVMNLCAHDFPLKTNFEIVRSLKGYLTLLEYPAELRVKICLINICLIIKQFQQLKFSLLTRPDTQVTFNNLLEISQFQNLF